MKNIHRHKQTSKVKIGCGHSLAQVPMQAFPVSHEHTEQTYMILIVQGLTISGSPGSLIAIRKARSSILSSIST